MKFEIILPLLCYLLDPLTNKHYRAWTFKTLKYWVGVQRGYSYRGEGASLALVGHPSSNGIMIKKPYGVDVLHQPASHPIFSYWVG